MKTKLNFIKMGGYFMLLLFARPSAAEMIELDPIIISTSRSAHSSLQAANTVTVYQKKDLENLPASDLNQVLSYLPGVSVQPSGPFGQSSSISVRGADSRQVLVMIDGIPFNNQLSGQANISRIPLNHIERIELIRGGMSSVWGSSLGGVINVITRSPQKDQKSSVKLTSSFAEFATTKNSLEFLGSRGKWGVYAMGSFLHSDGTLAQSRTQELKNYLKLTYDFNDESKLTSAFGYSGADLQYGPTNTRRIFKQPYISRYGQLKWNGGPQEHAFETVYKYNDQDVIADTYHSTTGARVSSTVSHDVYQGMSLLTHQTLKERLILTTGTDLDWHLIKSSAYLKKAEGINMQAPFANLLWSIHKWDLQPSIRYDQNSHFGSQLSPGLGVVYHFESWQGALVRSRVARVFNAPPLLWLYNDDPAQLVASNPDLKAERAYIYELGGEMKPWAPLKISAEGYYSEVNDGIAVVLNGSAFQSRNFRKFRRQGGLLRLDYRVSPSWTMYSSAEFNDVKNIDTKKIVRDAGIARQGFKWGTQFHSQQGYGANLEGYYSRCSASPTQANDRKPMLNLKLTKDVQPEILKADLEIFLNIYNLGNSKYWLNPTYPYPRRYFEGGFSAQF